MATHKGATLQAGTYLHSEIHFTIEGTSTAIDPDTVSFSYKFGNGSPITATYPDVTIVNDGTGVYYVDLFVQNKNPLIIIWQGIGTDVAIMEQYNFPVQTYAIDPIEP